MGPESSPGSGGSRRRAWVRRSLALIALLVGAALLIDLGAAAATEFRLSRQLRAAADLPGDPEVTIGGFPYLTARGSYKSLAIAAPTRITADAPGRRAVRIEAKLRDVHLPPATLPALDADTPIRAAHIEALVRLDQKTFGRYLGIVDLQVHTPAPERAGAGSPADGYVKSAVGVILTGEVPLATPDEPQRKVLVSVSADFSAVNGAIAVRATRVYTGPEDHAQAALRPGDEPRVLAAFTATLPPMPLPFSIPATGARGENADVVLVGDADDTTVTPGSFYPPR